MYYPASIQTSVKGNTVLSTLQLFLPDNQSESSHFLYIKTTVLRLRSTHLVFFCVGVNSISGKSLQIYIPNLAFAFFGICINFSLEASTG